jgi:hypothetical protein
MVKNIKPGDELILNKNTYSKVMKLIEGKEMDLDKKKLDRFKKFYENASGKLVRVINLSEDGLNAKIKLNNYYVNPSVPRKNVEYISLIFSVPVCWLRRKRVTDTEIYYDPVMQLLKEFFIKSNPIPNIEVIPDFMEYANISYSKHAVVAIIKKIEILKSVGFLKLKKSKNMYDKYIVYKEWM